MLNVIRLQFAGTRSDQAVQDSREDLGQLPAHAGGQLPQGCAVPQQPPRGRRHPVDSRPPQLPGPRGEHRDLEIRAENQSANPLLS